jgi:hypothetical protein
MLGKLGPSVDREEFLKGQIYIRSPILDKLISKSSIRIFLEFAQLGTLASFIVKSLPIPSFLFRKSDYDSRTFLRVIQSKVLDKTSTQLFLEIFRFAENGGIIELSFKGQKVRLPEDFDFWNKFPILLISSCKDELVLNSEVEEVNSRIKNGKHFIVDKEIGVGCGHAGYLFKRNTNELVRDEILKLASSI